MSADDLQNLPPRPAALDALPKLTLPAARRAAVWARIEVTTAVAAAAGAGTAAVTASKALTTKAAVAIALGALTAGVAAGVAADRFAFPPEPRVIERVITREVRVEVPVPAPTPEPTPELRPQPRPGKPAPKSEASGPDLERQGIEGARTALLRRDAAAALATLDQLAKDFPKGRLVEERDSLRLQALQQAGRDDEARAAARAFLKRYPNSVFGPAAEAILRPQ